MLNQHEYCIKLGLAVCLKCYTTPSTQVGLVLPRGKKIFQVCRGFELGSTGQKAAMLAPRPQHSTHFCFKIYECHFSWFFMVFFHFYQFTLFWGGIFGIFKAQKTLDSTELYLWDCYYSNFMTLSF